MRKIIPAIFLSTMVMMGSANSQTLNVDAQGSKAILFNFTGLSDLALTGYQGGIGGKYFISNGLALRGMLLFGLDNTTTNTTPQASTDLMSFGIGGGLEYHLALDSHVSPYVGGVITFTSDAETQNPGALKSNKSTIALGAIGGVEYFFNNNISLAAEYQFGLSTTTSSPLGGGPSTNEFQLGFQTFGLTMGVYF